MSVANEVLRVLPRLRRFGCMLLGSIEAADLALEKTIESVIMDYAQFNQAEDKPVELFRVFVSHADQLGIGPPSSWKHGASANNAVREHLSGLSVPELQVFLLRYVEEYDCAAVAKILDLPEKKVRDLERGAELKAG